MRKKLTNPIITGFNPDPVIFHDDEKYYIVVSTFEWLPGIRVYSSTNLYKWHYETSILTDSTLINLREIPEAAQFGGHLLPITTVNIT
ncbi:family 43 glycosylhydrolase [Pediococcus acidilactici]|uniref:family 43 glycosylhydrolase n=1 Tax=Pediococcus acidilactici TaxID=1254 RepID=UPI00228580F8|nr:family 43 glycosylhydrolase [Pediococcus acidilactici]